MRRRAFITLLGGAAAWPGMSWAQVPQPKRRVSVVLGLAENDPEAKNRAKAFRLGLRDLGWIEGNNVQVEYRYAGSKLDVINQHVGEVVRLAPEVIVGNSTPVLAALRPATKTIPIVFVVVNDPVGQGFISSLSRPGGNITGFSFIEPEIIGKWINLLRDVKPNLSRVAVMFNPATAPYYDSYLRSFKALPQKTGIEVESVHVRSFDEVNSAVAKLGDDPGSGLIAPGDPYILTAREAILKAADKYRVPIISPYRQFVVEGSLMSYGPDTADIFRRSSSYVDRILRGASPANLPAQSPNKFELVLNIRSAKALGLSFRHAFLQLADEVIE